MTTIKKILEDAENMCSSYSTGNYPNKRQIAMTNYLLAKLVQLKESEIGECNDE